MTTYTDLMKAISEYTDGTDFDAAAYSAICEDVLDFHKTTHSKAFLRGYDRGFDRGREDLLAGNPPAAPPASQRTGAEAVHIDRFGREWRSEVFERTVWDIDTTVADGTGVAVMQTSTRETKPTAEDLRVERDHVCGDHAWKAFDACDLHHPEDDEPTTTTRSIQP